MLIALVAVTVAAQLAAAAFGGLLAGCAALWVSRPPPDLYSTADTHRFQLYPVLDTDITCELELPLAVWAA